MAEENDTTNNESVQYHDGEQASTVTVNTEQHEQEQKEQQQQEELIAGKFKSQEDLVEAYKQLEQKLSKGGGSEEEAENGEETNENNQEQGENENEEGEYVYSEQLDGVLKEADLDPADIAKRFTDNGELSDDDYEKLNKSGFSREMVDAYISGLKGSQENAEAVTESQIDQIKASVGGEEAFGKVQKHIASTYSPEDVKAYNAILESGDVGKIQAAVQEANQSYLKEIGVEGEMVGGKTPQQNQGYESEAQMLDDMAKPEYKTSQAFRDEVAKKIAATQGVFVTR